jgi:hypothetical protein
MSAISATRRSMKELVDGTLRVQLDIDPAYRDDFLRLFSKIDMPVAIAPLVSDFEQRKEHEQTGHWVSALYKSGFWYNPKVLAALGTDAEYREWIQRQPSAYSDQFSEFTDKGARCEAAHVRRAGESGTGHKAEYACIPLNHAEHQLQHQKGESALGGQEWFDKMRAKYVAEWAHMRLRDALGVESLSGALVRFLDWADERGLTQTLPLALRSNAGVTGAELAKRPR